MREIVLDTETTGLDPSSGHRVVEIGCVELIDHMPTGETYQQYINPERDMPLESFNIHGLSESFLADYPVFASIVADFLAFIGDDKLVIHNAGFDIKFLNAEIEQLGFKPIPMSRAIDTVQIARTRFPGASASLDELCKRFGVDNSHRTSHGALLDSELLAEVYIDLIGAREPGLDLVRTSERKPTAGSVSTVRTRTARTPRPHTASDAERAAHAEFLSKLKDPIWLQGD